MATGGPGQGFPRGIFPPDTDVDGRFICSHCDHVLEEPFQNTQCGHHSCRACVFTTLATSDAPLCRRCLNENKHTKLLSHKVFPDKALRREMSRLRVRCPECRVWSGSFQGLDRGHWANCLGRNQAPSAIALPTPELRTQSKNPSTSPPRLTREALGQTASQITALEDQVKELLLATPDNSRKLKHLDKWLTDTTHTANLELQKLYKKIKQLERTIWLQEITLAEINAERELGTPSYSGSLLWKIPNYSQKKRAAVENREVSIESQEFFTSRHGYRMKACVYLNGDGIGKGTHLSLFLVIMRGEYDSLLAWPFQQLVVLQLVRKMEPHRSDRRNHVMTYRPNPNGHSSQRPRSERNVGCGQPQFALQGLVEEQFVREDTLFVQIDVDTRNLRDPADPTYTWPDNG